MRLPNWAYARLERVYLDQRQIRRQEQRDAVEREDQMLRAWSAREHEAHDSGMCGGAAAGCPFVPCVPFMGWGR